jgi:hypothetical protein
MSIMSPCCCVVLCLRESKKAREISKSVTFNKVEPKYTCRHEKLSDTTGILGVSSRRAREKKEASCCGNDEQSSR